MKKAQAKTNGSLLQRFGRELVVFPGYASVLFAWLGVMAYAAIGLLWLFGLEEKDSFMVVLLADEKTTTAISVVGQVLLGVLVAALLLGALWVYVSRWTKSAMRWLAKMLKLGEDKYYSFCVVVLLIGWVANAGLAYAFGGEDLFIVMSFVSASGIIIGSLSFAAASLLDSKQKLAKATKKTKKPATKKS